jgi:Uma2 family endonuclease
MSLPRDGFKYELLNGEITMSPAGFNHGRVCGKILRALGNHVEEQDLGVVCEGQTGFRLAVGFKRKTVLSPDVSFVTRERLAAARQSLDKFFEGGPDLAVEVLSLGDSLAKALNKMARFFRNGTRLGWIVDARVREVHVVLPDGTATVIKPAGTLTGGAVLPKFRLPVDRLLK